MTDKHPRCKTCRHFDARMDDWDNPAGLGYCKMIAEKWEMGEWDEATNSQTLKPDFAGHLAAVGDGSAYTASLYPSPEFYCAMHSDIAPGLKPYSEI